MTVLHPCLDENGLPVPVAHPSVSTARGTWLDSQAVATVSRTEKPDLPDGLFGTPFAEYVPAKGEDPWQWRDAAPDAVAGEPDFILAPGFRATSGCIVVEPDKRIWIVHPTNEFLGIKATFPKGRLEPVLSLAQNAVKETWEESGLLVEPVAFLADVAKRIVATRYFVARRVGGTPALCGWESQAVSLVPFDRLCGILNRDRDRTVLAALKTYLDSLP